MTFRECLQALRSRWVLVLLAAVIGLGAAVVLAHVQPQQYTSTLRLWVSARTDDDPGAAAQGAELATQRIGLYTGLVTSSRVTGQVVEQLGLTTSPEDLAGQVTAIAAESGPFIDVTVTDRSADGATAIANAIGVVVPDVVAQVEQATSANGVSLVSVAPLETATPPATSGGKLPVTLALGLLSGLAIGIAFALARSALDPRIRTVERLHAVVGAPILGVIARDPRMATRPLPVHDEPRGPLAEEFRRLRTNLQSLARTPGTTVVFTSPTPSVGKTTTVLNLGIALAAAGERVLVVEADLRRPVVADLLGLDSSTGLTAVLGGRVRPQQAVQRWSGLLDVLVSGPAPANPSELLASRGMRALLDGLKGQFDVVLVDTPPLLPVADATAVAPAATGVLLVCGYKQTTRAHLEASLKALQVVDVPVMGAVLTMVPGTASPVYSRDSAAYRGSAPPGAVVVPVPRSVPGTADEGRQVPAVAELPVTSAPPTVAHPVVEAASPGRTTGPAHTSHRSFEPQTEAVPTVAHTPHPSTGRRSAPASGAWFAPRPETTRSSGPRHRAAATEPIRQADARGDVPQNSVTPNPVEQHGAPHHSAPQHLAPSPFPGKGRVLDPDSSSRPSVVRG